MSKNHAFRKVEGVPNLYHRGGRYYARISELGKQTWRSLDTGKKTEAKRNLNLLMAGKGPEIKRRHAPGLHEAAGRVLEFRRSRRGISRPLSPETLRYHGELLKLVKQLFPDRRITSFTKEELLNTITDCGMSQSRRKAIFELLKGTFKQAAEDKQVERNPLAGIVPEQVPRKERSLPSREDLEAIFEQMEAIYPEAGRAASLSARLLAFSGLRWSEAKGLMWEHIEGAKLKVRGLNGRVKTQRSRRDIHINAPLKKALAEIAEVYGKRGGVMPMRSIRQHLAKACEQLEIPKVGHHDLRSWFATWCITTGVDVATTAAWLGDDPAVVLRTYVQPTEQDMQCAAGRLK